MDYVLLAIGIACAFLAPPAIFRAYKWFKL
jgi:hypothetical protein